MTPLGHDPKFIYDLSRRYERERTLTRAHRELSVLIVGRGHQTDEAIRVVLASTEQKLNRLDAGQP